MLETSGADVDHTVFEKGNAGHFGLLLGAAVQLLERSGEVISAHDGFDRRAAGRGLALEMEEEGGEAAEAYRGLADSIGEDFMNDFMGHLIDEPESQISDEDYDEAVAKKKEAATTLVDYTVGYHDFMLTNLAQAYGEDEKDEQVDEEAWTVTWKKLKEVLGGQEGTLLAEAAGFFDGLIRDKFGPDFKHMEEDRGPAVQADTCARTFYGVMQDHVPRAIVGANRDEWTGYQ